MGSKTNPGPNDCYSNALPDEPMFILLARDESAPQVVRMWASNRRDRIISGNKPQSDIALANEADEIAKQMEEWRKANNGKWRKS